LLLPPGHHRSQLQPIDRVYWVRADRINQGIATETAAALTRVAFEADKLDRVEIHCDADNVRSAAVPRKLGFTHEATLRRRKVAGKVRDTLVWTLLAEEYPSSAAAALPIEAFDAIGRKLHIG
jgi:RimJ/RimL family protein N-acetyltransferase